MPYCSIASALERLLCCSCVPVHTSYCIATHVKALVRWATGKRLTNRLPKLSLITLSEHFRLTKYRFSHMTFRQHARQGEKRRYAGPDTCQTLKGGISAAEREAHKIENRLQQVSERHFTVPVFPFFFSESDTLSHTKARPCANLRVIAISCFLLVSESGSFRKPKHGRVVTTRVCDHNWRFATAANEPNGQTSQTRCLF